MKRIRSLTGKGFLAVNGKVPLAVEYTIQVFIPEVELRDGSVVDETESASGTIAPSEPRDLSEYIGDHATLMLADAATWDCVVLNKEGRLEHRGGPTPGARNKP